MFLAALAKGLRSNWGLTAAFCAFVAALACLLQMSAENSAMRASMHELAVRENTRINMERKHVEALLEADRRAQLPPNMDEAEFRRFLQRPDFNELERHHIEALLEAHRRGHGPPNMDEAEFRRFLQRPDFTKLARQHLRELEQDVLTESERSNLSRLKRDDSIHLDTVDPPETPDPSAWEGALQSILVGSMSGMMVSALIKAAGIIAERNMRAAANAIASELLKRNFTRI